MYRWFGKCGRLFFYQAKHIKGQFEGTGELGTRAVKQDRTGQAGQNRTAREDSQDSTARKGYRGQDGQDITARTGQLG
jgi:hypothetical protein